MKLRKSKEFAMIAAAVLAAVTITVLIVLSSELLFYIIKLAKV